MASLTGRPEHERLAAVNMMGLLVQSVSMTLAQVMGKDMAHVEVTFDKAVYDSCGVKRHKKPDCGFKERKFTTCGRTVLFRVVCAGQLDKSCLLTTQTHFKTAQLLDKSGWR